MRKENFFTRIPRNLRLLSMMLLLSFSIVACNDDTDETPPVETRNLAMVAESRNDLNLFIAAAEQAGLTSALENENSELTVFAPNNQAFEAYLSAAGIDLADISQADLQEVLRYHIVQGRQRSGNLSTGNINSLNGSPIAVAVNGGVTLNGSASVVTADLEASNGVIHIINEVLTEAEPEAPVIAALLEQESDLSILMSILSRPQFSSIATAAADPESMLTVFAPTNTYFEQLLNQLGKSSVDELPQEVLTQIVSYHILGQAVSSAELESGMFTTLLEEDLTIAVGDGVTVNNIAVTEADLEASNGWVHKIEGVLLPAEARAVNGTVAGIAYFDADFTTLVAALREAELLNVLLEDGPYTVFAPTNAAFEAAGITDLSDYTQEELQNILLYHVTAGNITSAELEAGAVTTASEEEFYLSMNNNGVYINGNTMVSMTDLEADNGVVHVLNGVLMPPANNLAQIVINRTEAENPEFTLLLRAILRAELATTLAGEGPYTVFAPTDAAFEAAGFDAEAIDAASPEALTNILLYHVIPARVFSTDLTTGNVSAANDGTIMVDTESLSLTDEQDNTANLNADMLNILATNGVIHVIDAVLLPSE